MEGLERFPVACVEEIVTLRHERQQALGPARRLGCRGHESSFRWWRTTFARRLSETMREAILTAITVPASAETPNGETNAAPAAEQVAVHAIALQALLTDAPGVLSAAERQLLSDWLDQLAKTRGPDAPMRPAGDTRRS
jgi:hypothetical protein